MCAFRQGDNAHMKLPSSLAAILFSAAASISSFAQVQTAGSLIVNLDPSTVAAGPLATITNTGTAGGPFDTTCLADVDQAVIVPVDGGGKAIMFDGHSCMEHVTARGGASQPAPSSLVGQNPIFSVEAWVINASLFQFDIETIVSWGQRETGLGLMTF